jgi:nucleotide-binding universal stress UspA family protein
MTVLVTHDEFLMNKLVRQMEQVVEIISKHGITCSGEFHNQSDISDGVIAYSEKVNADLIIIMTQKELEWRQFIIGTESQQIINGTEIPVCSIRPIERKDTTEYVV